MAKTRTSAAIYQLKIVLQGIASPIWRRVEVSANTTLGKLHGVLQAAMGWEGGHLHQFEIGREHYGRPDPEDFEDVIDENRVRLDAVAGQKSRFVYEYDFGDGWQHQIVVEKVLDPAPGVRYPRLRCRREGLPTRGLRGRLDGGQVSLTPIEFERAQKRTSELG